MERSQLVYTVSMTFRKARKVSSGADLGRGYLDDFLVLSFGQSDASSHFSEIVVGDVLKDHEMCEDLMRLYNVTIQEPLEDAVVAQVDPPLLPEGDLLQQGEV